MVVIRPARDVTKMWVSLVDNTELHGVRDCLRSTAIMSRELRVTDSFASPGGLGDRKPARQRKSLSDNQFGPEKVRIRRYSGAPEGATLAMNGVAVSL